MCKAADSEVPSSGIFNAIQPVVREWCWVGIERNLKSTLHVETALSVLSVVDLGTSKMHRAKPRQLQAVSSSPCLASLLFPLPSVAKRGRLQLLAPHDLSLMHLSNALIQRTA